MYVSPIREPLIKGNKTYSQITKDITAPIEGKAGKAWYVAITISTLAMIFGFAMMGYTVWEGNRHMGLKQNRRMGLGNHQLCVVGRYRSCRYIYISHITSISSKVENQYKPFSRGDDNFRSYVRRHISTNTHGTTTTIIFYFSLPHFSWSLGKLQLSIIMGRICNYHILASIYTILVYGIDTRHRHLTR